MPSNGDSHPPKNMMLTSILIRIRFIYSARKNIAKATPEYSTWKPATISDSPSDTSNGALFVSAMPAMKYIINNGNKGNQYQLNIPPRWDKIISCKFRLPAAISTPTKAKPIAISYAII